MGQLERDPPVIDVFLDPGEYFVGDHRYQVRTLLGSCVSVILWHPRWQFGAMSHFLLAQRQRPLSPDAERLDGKYADESLQLMLHELIHAGIAIEECQAKVFGGGNMFPDHVLPETLNVGLHNGRAALALCKLHGLTVVAQDLYGDGHREIIFNVRNGDVWVRQTAASGVRPTEN